MKRSTHHTARSRFAFGIAALSCLLAAGVARADISANVRAVYYKGNQVVLTPGEPLVGSKVDASPWDAFAAAKNLASAIIQEINAIVDENPIGAFAAAVVAYKEINQLLTALSDKTALGEAGLSLLGDGQGVDRVELKFSAWSDDDPFLPTRVIAPNFGLGLSILPGAGDANRAAGITVGVPQYGAGMKTATVKVNIYPGLLRPGTYMVAFEQKENGDITSLSAIQIIRITIARNQCPVAAGSSCGASLDWDRVDRSLRSAQQQLLATAQGDRSWMQAFERYRKSWRAWQKNCPPQSVGQPPRACDQNEPQEPPSACPEILFSANQALCDRLAPLAATQANLLTQLWGFEQTIRTKDCCNMSINPRGLVAVPPKINFGTPPAGTGQQDRAAGHAAHGPGHGDHASPATPPAGHGPGHGGHAPQATPPTGHH